MDGQKERQGDFVFTAQSVGEYRFCFSNEMSTFAEKLVDFEIAVWPSTSSVFSQTPGAPPPAFPFAFPWLRVTDINNLLGIVGRKRTKGEASLPPRRLARASICRRGVHSQDLRAVGYNQQKPKVLPHARESEFQHRSKYREKDL
jgi:hypothetical protein